jgi:hypothetical protein
MHARMPVLVLQSELRFNARFNIVVDWRLSHAMYPAMWHPALPRLRLFILQTVTRSLVFLHG